MPALRNLPGCRRPFRRWPAPAARRSSVDDVVRGMRPDEVVVRHRQRSTPLSRSASWRTWRAVMRLPASTMTLSPIGRRSKFRVSPRRRSAPAPAHAFRPSMGEGVSRRTRPASLVVIAERTQQHRHRQLAAAVDARVNSASFGVELEVQPGAAVRDDAGAVEQLAELWVLPRSWSKNTPGERCSWETMTRSVPLTMKVPLSVMSGIRPCRPPAPSRP